MAWIMTLIGGPGASGHAARHRRRDRPRAGHRRRTRLARAGSGVRPRRSTASRPPRPNAPRATRSATPRSTWSCSRSRGAASGCSSPISNRRSSRTRCSTSWPISSACAPQVAEITRRAMNGELDFAAALAERVALLQGLPVSVLDEAASAHPADAGRAAAASRHRAPPACRTALVSGGFTVFAERVAASLGFDRVVANRLDIADGRIAGTVRTPIVDRRREAATRSSRSRRKKAFRWRRRWRSATAPTICRCCWRPGSASRSMPSRRSPPRRAGASITPI